MVLIKANKLTNSGLIGGRLFCLLLLLIITCISGCGFPTQPTEAEMQQYYPEVISYKAVDKLIGRSHVYIHRGVGIGRSYTSPWVSIECYNTKKNGCYYSTHKGSISAEQNGFRDKGTLKYIPHGSKKQYSKYDNFIPYVTPAFRLISGGSYNVMINDDLSFSFKGTQMAEAIEFYWLLMHLSS